MLDKDNNKPKHYVYNPNSIVKKRKYVKSGLYTNKKKGILTKDKRMTWTPKEIVKDKRMTWTPK